jgi:hypothetical protein
VTGDFQYLNGIAENLETIPCGYLKVERWQAIDIMQGSDDGHSGFRQISNPASMIGMMVGQKYPFQLEVMRLQVALYRSGFTGINHPATLVTPETQ